MYLYIKRICYTFLFCNISIIQKDKYKISDAVKILEIVCFFLLLLPPSLFSSWKCLNVLKAQIKLTAPMTTQTMLMVKKPSLTVTQSPPAV